MNVLVTGGSGKIGGYVLRELLSAGHTLSNFSQTTPFVEQVRHIQGDITDLEQMRQACRDQDAVVHLAAVPGPGITTPERLMYVNDRGAYNVLEAAVASRAQKVVFGSSKEAMNTDYRRFDTRPRYFPIDEEHPAQPRNEYGISKLINEITCKRFTEAYGIRTISLRINHNWYLDRAGAAVAVRSGTASARWRSSGRATGVTLSTLTGAAQICGRSPTHAMRRERSGWLWKTTRSGTRSS